MENKSEFRSSDFYQAVILKTVGFSLLRLEKTNGRFMTFVFEDLEHVAQDVLQSYWRREITVNARDLIETINELKTRVHSGV